MDDWGRGQKGQSKPAVQTLGVARGHILDEEKQLNNLQKCQKND